ncbi:MAG TPA: sigma-70 family RNA polymerase sigma factor [Pirellulaceae bacterium]|jgi:RNA polymerase sigma-70 factor (ECF subfamily)|nr:sigma-70 family RNA polymerase sigma factor [Pirellulaceae bacterium]
MGNSPPSGDILAKDVAVQKQVVYGKLLVERIDSDRLQELIDSHGAALKLYARQWCNSPDDALQEALIELLRQSPVPHHPTAWLFKTIRLRAMNLSRGERRRSEHHRRASEQRDEWFIEEEGPGFDNGALSKLLDQLPSMEREIVVARIWGELPFERIAEIVGSSSSSVHRHYRAALLMLRRMIGDDEGGGENGGETDESQTQTRQQCDV